MAMVVGDGAAQAARRQHTGAQAQQQLTRWRTPGSARAHAGTPTAPSQSDSARSSSREPAAGPGTAGEHGGAWRHWGRVKPRTDAARQPGVHHPPAHRRRARKKKAPRAHLRLPRHTAPVPSTPPARRAAHRACPICVLLFLFPPFFLENMFCSGHPFLLRVISESRIEQVSHILYCFAPHWGRADGKEDLQTATTKLVLATSDLDTPRRPPQC